MGMRAALIFPTLAFLCAAMYFILPAQSSCASTDLPASCDAGFMNQIKARAALSAEREMANARTIITKPDSVLEYSCFHNSLGHMLSGATLSQSDDFASQNFLTSLRPPSIPKTISLNVDTGNPLGEHLNNVVQKPLAAYLSDNFTGMGYGCGQMQAIWTGRSQCENFNDANFLTFEELASGDLRGCGAATDDVANALQSARNPAPEFATASFDAIAPQYDKTEPPGSSFVERCADIVPVPTGLKLENGQDEKTCLSPYCYYDGSVCKP